MQNRPIWLRLGINAVVITAAALLLARCSKNNSATPGTFTSVYETINSVGCAQCHNGSDLDGTTLDFSSQQSAYNALVNNTVMATDVVGTCGSLKLVNNTASDPATSYLEAEIGNKTYYSSGSSFGPASCYPYNHLLGLNSDQISSITQWIQAGAPNN